MSADRRRRLLEAAASEFASAGYENASLNRIIEQCEMSKSSFYYVFSSKAELFDFVIAELIDQVTGVVRFPSPKEFAGEEFWLRLERFFADLVATSQQHEAFLTLGRMFYNEAPATARTTVNATLAAVRTWVSQLLQVGRGSGAVRDDLPEQLQALLLFRILQVFDEWTLAHYDQMSAGELSALADAQFATIRRMLER